MGVWHETKFRQRVVYYPWKANKHIYSVPFEIILVAYFEAMTITRFPSESGRGENWDTRPAGILLSN